MPKISVIIPIYNAEHDLAECLDSVCSQTLSDIEIICVNDGSTDHSFLILQSYIQKDPRFKAFCQSNHGVAHARNVALNHATGTFIAFLDPDDLYPSANVLEMLYHVAIEQQVAVVGGGVERFSPKAPEKLVRPPSVNSPKEGLFIYAEHPFDYGYVRFIYKRTLLEENTIHFPPYARYQDPPFFVRAMIAAKRYYVLTQPVYRYRFVPNHVQWSKNNYLRLRHLFLGMRDVAMLAQMNHLPQLIESLHRRLLLDYRELCIPIVKKLLTFSEFQSLLSSLPPYIAYDVLKVYTRNTPFPFFRRLRLALRKGWFFLDSFGIKSLFLEICKRLSLCFK